MSSFFSYDPLWTQTLTMPFMRNAFLAGLCIALSAGIIGYFTIPTVAGWVIQAGGAGNFGKNVNYAAGKGAGIAGAVGGAVGGFAGGHARNAMSYAGSKAKDVAGRLFHRGGNKSPESSEQN